MRKWKVTYEGMTPEGHDDLLLEFMEIDDIVPKEKQFILTKEYFLDFMKIVKGHKHYHVLPQIKKVITPEGNTLSGEYFFHIKGDFRSKDGINYLSVLLEIDRSGDLFIRGLGQDSVNYTKKNPDYLKYFLLSASTEPQNWSTVMFVGPIEKYVKR